MAREDMMHSINSEFKLWGVKFNHRTLGSNHIELRWQVDPVKEVRTHVIASTASDWRAPLNERAAIRRLFKADGLSLKTPEKKKPIIQKALELPTHVESDADQIRMMRSEIGDLTELVLEMAAYVSTINNQLVSMQARPMIEQKPPEEKPSARSIKTIDFVSDSWSSTDALARDMGLSILIAKRKLCYLEKQDILESSGGRWRRKPKKPAINGNGKDHPPHTLGARVKKKLATVRARSAQH
jgi:hypothetical protein